MAIWTHWGGADAKWSLEIKMGWRRVVRDHLIVSDRKLFSWFNMHHNLKVHTLAAEWHGISGSGGRWTPVCCVCVCVWPGFPLSDKQCTIQLENKYNKNYKNMPLQLQIVTGRTFRGWISRSHPQEIKQLRESLNSSRILFEAACQVIILSHYQVLSKNFLPELSHSADLDLFCLLLLQEKQGEKNPLSL